MEKADKEMDIFELMEKIASICKQLILKIGNGILWLIRFKIKNWIILSVFALVGVAIAYYSYLPQNREKFVDFRVQVNGAKSFALNDIAKSLSQKIDYDNGNKDFAKLLGVESEKILSLKAIEPFYVIDLNNNLAPDYVDYDDSFEADSLNSRMKHLLEIRLLVKGKGDFRFIQESLISYFKQIPYLHEEGKERIRVINNRISVLEDEIATLDSMRFVEMKDSRLSFKINKKGFVVERPSYHEAILRLEEEKSFLLEKLELQYDVVTIYSDVVVKNKLSNVYIFVSRIVFAVLFGFMIALFITYRKEIKTLLSEK